MDVVMPLREHFEPYLVETAVKLIRKNLPHRHIYFFGGNPNIKETTHIPFPDKNKENIEANLIRINLEACKMPQISSPFIWTADDIFIQKPLNKVPLFRKDKLLIGLSRYDWSKEGNEMKYIRRCINTAITLEERRLTTYNFDCHLPCPIHKKEYTEAYSMVNWDTEGMGVLLLTVYGNYMISKGFEVEQSPFPYGDAKSLLSLIDLNNKEDITEKLKHYSIFSPSIEKTQAMQEYIKELF